MKHSCKGLLEIIQEGGGNPTYNHDPAITEKDLEDLIDKLNIGYRMLEQTTYKVEQFDEEWGVIETRRVQNDWGTEINKVLYHGNLSDCYAYMKLKETGQI